MKYMHVVKPMSSMKKGNIIVQTYLESEAKRVTDLMLPSCHGHLTYAVNF